MLLFAHVTLAVSVVVAAGRVRDSLLAAERRLFLRNWQIRQLAPDLSVPALRR